MSSTRVAGGWKLRWREKQADGSWRARGQTVSTSQAATQLRAEILRALETSGYWMPPRAPEPVVAAAVADLERGALAWLEAEKARGLAAGTLRTRGIRLNVWHRALRAVLKLRDEDVIPCPALNRQTFAKALLTLAVDNPRAGERARYDIACTAFAAWEWMTDDLETYAGLQPAPRDRTRVLPRVPIGPETLPAGTLAEMDAVIRGALVVAQEARAGSFVLADLPELLTVQRYTGLRTSSVEGVRVCDVFATEGTIRVVRDKSRRMRGRVIPVSPHGMVILTRRAERLRAGGAEETATLFAPMHDDAAPKAFAAAAPHIRPEIWSGGADRAGGRTTHCFRAALQRDLEERGVKARVIDRLVGHTPEDVRTKHYVPPTIEEMRAAVALIPPVDYGEQRGNVVPLLG